MTTKLHIILTRGFEHSCSVYYRQEARSGIVFSCGLILGFFALQGRHGVPIRVKFGREERLRDVGLLPQNFENFEFYEYYCP